MLDPDLAEVFHDSAAVNRALRAFIRLAAESVARANTTTSSTRTRALKPSRVERRLKARAQYAREHAKGALLRDVGRGRGGSDE